MIKVGVLLFLVWFGFHDAYGSTKRYYREIKINVPIDQLSFSRNDTFKLRYLVNDTFWKSDDGPIFFYTGNEGYIEEFATHCGFMWDIAQEFRALIVFAEHRYYGQSLPFGNKSLSLPMYSGFLTTSQALADYVDVINHLKVTLKASDRNPIITFGGSYGGMLAAYFRLKYPHLIAGAIAASAPIHQFSGMIPCDASIRIVTSSFNDSSKSCMTNIKKSWIVLRNITKSDDGKAWLSKEWKLCNPLKNETDIQTLVDFLTSSYFTIAMVNYPYESNFIAPLPPNPVRAFCRFLKNEINEDKTLLQALFKGVDMYSNYTGVNKCLKIDSDGLSSSQLSDETWNYQSCTEMIMPSCTTGETDMFEVQSWNETDYTNKCKLKYGVIPRYNLASDEYGGSKLEAGSNIVFSNGLLDPWAAGGILKNVSQTIRAIIIPEGAHHLDLMGSNPSDPVSVLLARKYHKQSIRLWISQREQYKNYIV